MTRPRRWRLALVSVLVVVAAGACGGDEGPTGYTAENRRAFLAACTQPVQDSTLVRDVCECAYEEIRAAVAYEELVEMEHDLAVDALAPLPDYVIALVADCFITEAEL